MSSPGIVLFDLKVGKVLLSRYRIEETLAHGPLSARFRVHDQQTNTDLALELFTSGLFESPGQASFFAERLSAYSEASSGIAVKTHSVETTDDGDVLRFCTMPAADSLRDRLENQEHLPREEVVAMVTSLLKGLADLHGHGVAHGDLKPSTVYAGEDGALTVEGGVTPGLWRAQHMGARTSLIGTPYYSPLEQFGGDAPDADADLYAVGTLAYEALSGSLPWSGKGFIEVFQSKMEDNPPPVESRSTGIRVGEELEKVVRKAIRARRRDRYQSAQTFLDDWTAASATPIR